MSTPGELVDSQDFFGNVSSDDTQNQGTGSSTEGDAAHPSQLSRCVLSIPWHTFTLRICLSSPPMVLNFKALTVLAVIHIWCNCFAHTHFPFHCSTSSLPAQLKWLLSDRLSTSSTNIQTTLTN